MTIAVMLATKRNTMTTTAACMSQSEDVPLRLYTSSNDEDRSMKLRTHWG